MCLIYSENARPDKFNHVSIMSAIHPEENVCLLTHLSEKFIFSVVIFEVGFVPPGGTKCRGYYI